MPQNDKFGQMFAPARWSRRHVPGKTKSRWGRRESERQKDENDGEPELERVCEERHPLLGKEDLGNKEPHARCGWQLSWPQQVKGLFVVVPGMQPRGQGGLPRPQRRCWPWEWERTCQLCKQRDGEEKGERVVLGGCTSLYSSTACKMTNPALSSSPKKTLSPMVSPLQTRSSIQRVTDR